MTRTLAIEYALMVVVAASVFALSFAAPAMAEDQGKNIKVVMKILDSANAEAQAKILELQQQGIAIPLGTEVSYGAAVAEYQAAKEALESGNSDWAKFHAMRAMEMFKTLTDLLGSQGNWDDKKTIADANELDERIARLEKQADRLETLAESNHVSVGFADYDSAFQAFEDARARGDVKEAIEQLGLAKSTLEQIQAEIQAAADDKKEDRINKFVEKMIKLLSKIVDKAEKNDQMADREFVIQQLSNVIEKLQSSEDVQEIMEIMEDSSELQSSIDQQTDDLSHSDILEEVHDEQADGSDTDDSSNEGTGSDNSGSEDSDNEGTGSDNSGSDSSGSDNSGSDSSSDNEAKRLTDLADDLEERANSLLQESDNLAADLLIQEALTLISNARESIDNGSYDAAEEALSAAEIALDEAEGLMA